MNGAIVLIFIVAAVVLVLWLTTNKKHKKTPYTPADEKKAELAYLDLVGSLHDGEIEEVDDIDPEQIYIATLPPDDMASNRENLTFFHPVDHRYWPYYYYSYPYNYPDGAGAWPPGMSSRLYNWYPGFNTSGWSFWLRPGVTYAKWPQNRWVRKREGQGLYYINNGPQSERKKDYY